MALGLCGVFMALTGSFDVVRSSLKLLCHAKKAPAMFS